jgi:hypothetical protein
MRIRAASLSPLSEGEVENSPGWSPRRRIEPWDGRPFAPGSPRRVVRSSPPYVARIEINAVFFQERDEFCLEVDFLMMFLLARDVGQRCAYLSATDGERPVAFLPRKVLDCAGFVHPMRGRALDLPHSLCNRDRRWKRKKNVDVIVGSSNRESFHIVFSRNASHVSPHPRLNLWRDGLAPLLCGEDTMKKRATVGV